MGADTKAIMGTAKLSVAKLRLHKGKSCSRCYGNKIFSANINRPQTMVFIRI